MTVAMQLPLGEVIAWSSRATSHAALLRGLEVAALDLTLARDMLPRNAFSRALRKMAENRVIRPLSEDTTQITFQFTKAVKIAFKFHYDLEASMLADSKPAGDPKSGQLTRLLVSGRAGCGPSPDAESTG